jgi:hypothetical protein
MVVVELLYKVNMGASLTWLRAGAVCIEGQEHILLWHSLVAVATASKVPPFPCEFTPSAGVCGGTYTPQCLWGSGDALEHCTTTAVASPTGLALG